MSQSATLDGWQVEIEAAIAALKDRVRRTPLLPSRSMGSDLFLKAENLQVSGSFKYRPALNAILASGDAAKERGVVAASSGNFALGVAIAAQQEGVAATLVAMPSASAFKVARVEELGAKVVRCDDSYEARQPMVDQIMATTGAVELSPHSFRETIAGGATTGLEILDESPDIERILVPTSGGGLLAGISLAVALRGSAAEVIGVQSTGNPAFALSLAARDRQVHPKARTVADGLVATTPGDLPFQIALQYVSDVVTVPDTEILEMLRRLALEESLVVEPSGAAAMAAWAYHERFFSSGQSTACVLTGGNVAPSDWASWIR